MPGRSGNDKVQVSMLIYIFPEVRQENLCEKLWEFAAPGVFYILFILILISIIHLYLICSQRETDYDAIVNAQLKEMGKC